MYNLLMKRKGDRTKDRILDAATDLFAEKGYSAASVHELGERVGLKHTAILHHFGSKLQLFEACLFRAFEKFGEILHGLIEPQDNSLTQMTKSFEANILMARDHTKHITLVVGMYPLAIHEPKIRGIYRKILDESRQRYEMLLWGSIRERSIRSNIDPKLLSEIIHEFIIGTIINYLAAADRNDASIELQRKKWSALLEQLK